MFIIKNMLKKEIYSQKNMILIVIVLIIIIVGIYLYINKTNEEDDAYIFDDSKNEIVNNAIQNEIEDNTIEEKDEQEKIIVHVTGSVERQGIVSLNKGQRVIDAIEASGGATKEANTSLINLAYVLEDGMKIYVPSKDDNKDTEFIVSGYSEEVKSTEKKKQEKVNINTATLNELENLPGIGESIANKILTYRNKNGKFKNIEDLKNVSGIGESKFNNIKNYIYVK